MVSICEEIEATEEEPCETNISVGCIIYTGVVNKSFSKQFARIKYLDKDDSGGGLIKYPDGVEKYVENIINTYSLADKSKVKLLLTHLHGGLKSGKYKGPTFIKVFKTLKKWYENM
jgi:hypothetical protein